MEKIRMNLSFDHLNVLKNVIFEVIRSLQLKRIPFEEDLVNYFVRLQALNYEFGISFSTDISREELETFVNRCTTLLADSKSISITTLKMQFYFTRNFLSKEEIVRKYHHRLIERLKPLGKEIITSPAAVTKDETDKLYKKILVYVILNSSMGNPTEIDVLNECAAALRSVYPSSDISNFNSQNKRDRIQVLKELTYLVAGVRIFNRDTGKGGAGIVDLPGLISESIESTRSDLQLTLRDIMETVNVCTSAFVACFVIDKDYYKAKIITPTDSIIISAEELEEVKATLINYRQYEVYIRRLLSAIDIVESDLKEIMEKLRIELEVTKELVQYKMAIPSNQIFPIFLKISKLWFELHDQLYIISDVQTTLQELKNMNENVGCVSMFPNIMLQEHPVLTDAERLEETMREFLPTEGLKTKIRDMSSLNEPDGPQLQYLGFCPWSLVEGDGILIPANPNMGLLEWNNELFAFSCAIGATGFGQQPEIYKAAVLHVVRNRPALVHLLQLEDCIMLLCKCVQNFVVKDCIDPNCSVKGNTVAKKQKVVHITNAEVQTETHLREENIVPEYRWNIWDMKRDAMQLSKVLRCMTKSSQTLRTYGMLGTANQTVLQRAKQTQTLRDNYTNCPIPFTYINGLKTRVREKQIFVDATRPITEEYYTNSLLEKNISVINLSKKKH